MIWVQFKKLNRFQIKNWIKLSNIMLSENRILDTISHWLSFEVNYQALRFLNHSLMKQMAYETMQLSLETKLSDGRLGIFWKKKFWLSIQLFTSSEIVNSFQEPIHVYMSCLYLYYYSHIDPSSHKCSFRIHIFAWISTEIWL